MLRGALLIRPAFSAAMIAAVLLLAVASCDRQAAPADGPAGSAPSAHEPAGAVTAANSAPARMRIEGTQFITPDGTPFHWRGVTAFRLVEMLARGRKADVAGYLDWAASQQLTVVRVLTMATHLFELTPEDGVRALPELLEMAAERGLYVEVVALADTGDMPVDIDAHVKAIGEIAGRHPNALVEMANEPIHRTQAARVHDPAELAHLARLVPDAVHVALGSAERNEQFSAGDYATFHFPRERDWQHVLEMADGAAMLASWSKPLINDEPIGAAPVLMPGRRDNDPARFRAAALMTRLAGMGATFHYEAGLQAGIPAGRELECFNAWNEAWTLLPADVESGGTFRRAGEESAAVQSFDKSSALAVVERQRGSQAWVLVLDVRAEPGLTWQAGWAPSGTRRLDRVWLVTATRSN